MDADAADAMTGYQSHHLVGGFRGIVDKCIRPISWRQGSIGQIPAIGKALSDEFNLAGGCTLHFRVGHSKQRESELAGHSHNHLRDVVMAASLVIQRPMRLNMRQLYGTSLGERN